MTKYEVHTGNDCSDELNSLAEALKVFESWKDDLMSEGVVADESYVEILQSEDDFENFKIIKKVIAVVDNERTELGSPREEGCDWDYWAKWREITE